MLSNKDAMATIAVKNLKRAREFYEDTLQLSPTGEQGEEAITYKSGNSQVVVYESKFAGTNQATAATWGLGSKLEDTVKELKRAGITFEHYDFLGAKLDGDIHTFGDFRAAWFKDPDGNILHINNG